MTAPPLSTVLDRADPPPLERGGGPARDLLDTTLARLEAGGIDLAVVREAGRDGAGRLEVDLLVRPRHLGAAERALVADGFRRRPGWGRRPHRFHLRPVAGPDGRTIDWLKLDLVTDLAFGPWHELRAGLGDACLDARAGRRLHPADELAALLLHLVLDGGGLSSARRRRLRELAHRSAAPGPVGTWAAPAGATEPSWDDLLQAVRDGDPGALRPHAEALRARMAEGRRVATVARLAANRAARHGAKVATAVAARGRTVAVIGPDGTGKSTLTAGLASPAGLGPGISTHVLYGGTHPEGTRRSALPGGTTARILGRLLATRARVAWHRSRGHLVVLDRHPLQVRPLPGTALDARTARRRQVLARALPTPDLVLVLDAPGATLHARRPEHDLLRLEQDRAHHLTLAARHPRAVVVDASADADEVRCRAVTRIWASVVPGGPGRRAEGP
ncbi:MAG TPA: hypothetical protein VHK88_03085 [Aquihabitans sp.]|jgi:thymidylate kinase|nr:hypothetical protein [Aquihabitans sp.]